MFKCKYFTLMTDLKQKFRNIYIQKRKDLTQIEIDSKSKQIAKKALEIEEVNSSRKIAIYISSNHEVETKQIIDGLLKFAKDISVPAYSKRKKDFYWSKFSGWANLEQGPFKIPQPKDPAESLGIFDIAFVPGLAFSRSGVRLGYGKGIFDKLLLGTGALKIGLAYDFQVVDELPEEQHDLRMDIIITEERVLRIEN